MAYRLCSLNSPTAETLFKFGKGAHEYLALHPGTENAPYLLQNQNRI